jgi:hypothetical protein
MINVKITTDFPEWPLVRQTPNSSSKWSNYNFYINKNIKKCDYWVVYEGLKEVEEVICPKENTIFITGEPPSIKKYNPEFINQFGTIITCQKNINHPNIIFYQQALPWRVGMRFIKEKRKWDNKYSKSYDELISLKKQEKEKLLSVVISNKRNTKIHKKRLRFVKKLKKYYKEKLDVFGAGLNEISDKWDAIAPYKYHIVIENSAYKDYWTEKLSDTFLAGSYPFYFGCPNLSDYFSNESFTNIDINNFKQAILNIEKAIKENKYESSIKKIQEARYLILDKYNFFPMIISIFNKDISKVNKKGKIINLKPESHYSNFITSIYFNLKSIIKK